MFKKPSVNAKSQPPRKSPAGAVIKRASSATKRASSSSVRNATAGPQVTVAHVGGFRVFGSVVRPAHFTEEQILDAVASLE